MATLKLQRISVSEGLGPSGRHGARYAPVSNPGPTMLVEIGLRLDYRNCSGNSPGKVVAWLGPLLSNTKFCIGNKGARALYAKRLLETENSTGIITIHPAGLEVYCVVIATNRYHCSNYTESDSNRGVFPVRGRRWRSLSLARVSFSVR